MRVNSDSASESLRFTVALFHRLLSAMQHIQLVDKNIFYYLLADDLNNYHSYIIQSDLLYSRLITCS